LAQQNWFFLQGVGAPALAFVRNKPPPRAQFTDGADDRAAAVSQFERQGFVARVALAGFAVAMPEERL
jgi:hypothetical protein